MLISIQVCKLKDKKKQIKVKILKNGYKRLFYDESVEFEKQKWVNKINFYE